MEKKNKGIIAYLLSLIVILLVGLPVLGGLTMIMMALFGLLFGFLVAGTAVTSMPFVAEVEPAMAQIVSGIPMDSVFYFGLGFVFIAVFLFAVFGYFIRSSFGFVFNMMRRMLGGEG